MKVYQTKDLRNITLIGNAGAGKTILTESMLFSGGVINRKGDIGSKNTASDYRVIEQEQGNSIFATVLYTEYNDKKFNIIDTPGADSYIGSVVSALNVTDTALMLLNSQNGVEVGAEITFRQVKKLKRPMLVAVNHLDHEQSNFDKTIDEAKERFGSPVSVIQFPVNVGLEFNAVIDIIKMKMLTWKSADSQAEESEIPADLKDKAAELQEAFMENIAAIDETLMEKFFEAGTLSEEEMKSGLLKGIVSREIYPVFCINASKGYGVRRLLEFIGNNCPSPNLMPGVTNSEGTEIKCAEGGVSLYIFKNSIEQHLGEVLYFKVMQGDLEEGVDLMNHKKNTKERLSQIFVSAGKNRNKISKVCAGDIAATVKLKETKNMHTLNIKELDWTFPEIVFPNPKFRVAVKAENEADEEKLGDALNKMNQEDPTLIIEYSKELKQLIVHGQSEQHLNMLKWFLNNQYKIEVNYLAPKIPYRETITKTAYASYRHKKQSGGSGQFGEVHIIMEPYTQDKPEPKTYKIGGKEYTVNVRDKQEYTLDWGGKLEFYNCIVGGVIDTRFMPAILKGVMEKMEEGPLTGCYARDIRYLVFDGKMHPVDSNEISFKLAGLNAFKIAFKEAGPKIMEPIYDVEVLVPSDRMGDVMSDLQGRRSIIQGMSSEGGYEVLKAKVPLAELSKYSTALSSLTNGRATYDMKFSEYTQVPPDVQEVLLKEYEASQEE